MRYRAPFCERALEGMKSDESVVTRTAVAVE